MAVFNSIDFDGRVQRSATALSEIADVTVVAIDSGRPFRPQGYALRTVRLPPRKGSVARWAHPYFWLRLWWLALTLRPTVVYAHDFFMGVAGRIAAQLASARYIYDAHELIVPEQLPGGAQPHGARDEFWYRVERAGIHAADAVVCANEVRAAIMREHYGLTELPAVIRNIPPRPADFSRAAEVHPSIRRLLDSAPDTVLCVYQGDVSVERGLDVLVDAFAGLQSHFHLLIVGGGPDVRSLQERVRERQLGAKVTFLGKVPHNQLHGILRAAHIGLITYPTSGANNLHCAPNKIFEYAQAGLPMVMTSQPGLKVYLDRHAVGRAFDSSRREAAPALAAQAIRDVAEQRDHHVAQLEPFLAENDWSTEREKLVRVLVRTIGPQKLVEHAS